MKFLRGNFAYILLALIAVVLIFVTISLQVTILSTQGSSATSENRGILYTVRQQLAELILPATDGPPTASQPTTATTLLDPTNTPIVIVVQSTPALPTPTATPVEPIPTVVVQVNAPTATLAPAATATSPVLPTSTPIPKVDFRLGYVTNNHECAAITELMSLVLERNFNLSVATIAFPDAASLFAKLAAKTETERVDLTFCYIDPADRSYLQKYFGFMIFVGSGYRQVDNQKFIIMSNAAVKSPIERGNPCLYRFLTSLNLNNVDFDSGTMAAWYENNAEQVNRWTRCE
jgi:hypothetical protein